MKIVFDLTSLYDHISGVERYAMELSLAFIDAYKEYEYVLIFKNKIHEKYESLSKRKNVRCIILKGQNKLVFGQITLLKCLYKIKADAYIFLAFPQPLLFFSKCTYTAIHDMTPWEMADTMQKKSLWYYRLSHIQSFIFSKKIITISKFSAERIMALTRVKKNRIAIVRCGVTDMMKANTSTAVTGNETYKKLTDYILTLSTLEPRKNLELLLDAYGELLDEGVIIPDLVIAGRNGWKSENLFKNRGEIFSKKVHIAGFVSEEDMKSVYENAAMFVFPSKYEGFGMPPLEAMSHGVPVLSSDASSMPEVLGKAATYFKSDDKESLKAQLKEMILISTEKRQAMIDKGVKRAQRFKWDIFAKTLKKHII